MQFSYLIYSCQNEREGERLRDRIRSFKALYHNIKFIQCFSAFLFSFTFPLFFLASQDEKRAEIYYVVVLQDKLKEALRLDLKTL